MKQERRNNNDLQADGGHYLTQSADVPIDERVFGNTAYISDPSEASKYRQVSEAEKERMLNAGTILDRPTCRMSIWTRWTRYMRLLRRTSTPQA